MPRGTRARGRAHRGRRPRLRADPLRPRPWRASRSSRSHARRPSPSRSCPPGTTRGKARRAAPCRPRRSRSGAARHLARGWRRAGRPGARPAGRPAPFPGPRSHGGRPRWPGGRTSGCRAGRWRRHESIGNIEDMDATGHALFIPRNRRDGHEGVWDDACASRGLGTIGTMRRILLWASRNRWLKGQLPRFGWVGGRPGGSCPARRPRPPSTQPRPTSRGASTRSSRCWVRISRLTEARAVADAYHTLIDEIAGRGLDGESRSSSRSSASTSTLRRPRALRRPGQPFGRTGQLGLDRHGGRGLHRGDHRVLRAERQARERRHLPQAYLHRSPADIQRLLAVNRPFASSKAPTTSPGPSRIGPGRKSTVCCWPSRPSSSRPSAMTAPGSSRRPTTSPSSSA